MKEEKSQQSLKDQLFMIWDGLSFFGFAEWKLERVKGAPQRWHDRFTSKYWMVTYILGLALVMYVLIGQILNFGEIKMQRASVITRGEYKFNVTEQMTLLGVNYMNTASIV
jgi:hypothetical protein